MTAGVPINIISRMINNLVRGLRVAGAALCLLAPPGCGARAAAVGSEPLQGVVELDEQRLGFEVGGRVRAVRVKAGDEVAPGQVLAELDDTLARAMREARAAELAAAEAQAHLAHGAARPEEVRATTAQLAAAQETVARVERSLARQRTLTGQGAAPSATLDELEGQLSRAQAEVTTLGERLRLQRAGARSEERAAADARVRAAKAALEAETVRLERHQLKALSRGRVLAVYADPGEVVQPGAPVLAVADAQRPYVDVFVPQGRLAGVRAGLSARVRVDAEPQPFPARVEEVGRKTEFTPKFLFSPKERPNLVVRVRLRIDDPAERLHAGVPAFAQLEAAR